MTETIRLSLHEAFDLCNAALLAAGASPSAARSLADSSVEAEAQGQPSVGLAHLIDHLEALRAGRILGDAAPSLSRPAPAMILSDAMGGIAQLGFDLAFDDLTAAARQFGIALFAQNNAYTSGALGLFVARLAAEGLVALAATSGPPIVAGSGGTEPVFCTNPLAFAAPQAGGPPLIIDQSSSATAFVNIRRAAREGRPIPEGWALDAQGRPTTDANAAIKGALLAFGGGRGANIALMVEVLAAGVTGANWALDAPPFSTGSQSPGSGLLVVAIEPKLLDPAFESRMATQLDRLGRRYGVYVPGIGKADAARRAGKEGLAVPSDLIAALRSWIVGQAG
jgi:(2R)-3-sulfolactate dehydrogenase (NADP+)